MKVFTKYALCIVLFFLLQACQPEYKTAEQSPVATNPLPDNNQAALPTEPAKEEQSLEERIREAEQGLRSNGLVDVQSLDSTIQVELKYSTTDNFVGVDVYGDIAHAYLQPKPAEKLAQAQRYLKELHPNYRLLVYDGARSRSVQQVLWDTLDKPVNVKPLYVADPKVGSIHNYGAAVDLTIADSTGTPLDMGTPYDFFGVLAYPSKEEEMLMQGKLTEEQINNRK